MILENKNGIYIKINDEQTLLQEIKDFEGKNYIYKAVKLDYNGENRLSKESINEIAKIMKKYLITEINLSDVKIGDEGLKDFCSLFKKFYVGFKINLNNCSISDKGAKFLGKYFKNIYAEIDSIDLGNNNIGFPGYYAVRKIIKSTLYCEGNKMLEYKFGKTLCNMKEYESKSDTFKALALSFRNVFKLGFSFTKHEECKYSEYIHFDGEVYPICQKIVWRDYNKSEIDWCDFSNIIGNISYIES